MIIICNFRGMKLFIHQLKTEKACWKLHLLIRNFIFLHTLSFYTLSFLVQGKMLLKFISKILRVSTIYQLYRYNDLLYPTLRYAIFPQHPRLIPIICKHQSKMKSGIILDTRIALNDVYHLHIFIGIKGFMGLCNAHDNAIWIYN